VPSAYYLERPYFFLHPHQQGIINFEEVQSPDELARRLAGFGVKYIYVNLDWLEKVTAETIGQEVFMAKVSALIRSPYARLVYSNDASLFATRNPLRQKVVYRTALYRIKSPGRSAPDAP